MRTHIQQKQLVSIIYIAIDCQKKVRKLPLIKFFKKFLTSKMKIEYSKRQKRKRLGTVW